MNPNVYLWWAMRAPVNQVAVDAHAPEGTRVTADEAFICRTGVSTLGAEVSKYL